MFFDRIDDLWRVTAVGVLAYLLLIAIVRLSGKRTLAKLNAFDLVVTVALGSALSTILLSPAVSLAEGVTALALLTVLQFAGTWLSKRYRAVQRLIKSRPTLLLRDGEILDAALQHQRVTSSEIRQAVRSHGIGDLSDVAAVVLETDGTFSVIPRGKAGSRDALQDVDNEEGHGRISRPTRGREEARAQQRRVIGP